MTLDPMARAADVCARSALHAWAGAGAALRAMALLLVRFVRFGLFAATGIAGRSLIRLIIASLGFAWASSAIYAESIQTKSALVREGEEAWVVDAEFDFSLTTPLETALLRGTPLYFVLDSEITRSRSFWFDESVTTRPSVRRLTYVPLTSTYRVDAGGSFGVGASYASLDDALRQIRVIRGRELVPRRALRAGERYEVSLRLRLDVSQLPKPLQVNTLVSREWTLFSEWYRVVVTP